MAGLSNGDISCACANVNGPASRPNAKLVSSNRRLNTVIRARILRAGKPDASKIDRALEQGGNKAGHVLAWLHPVLETDKVP